MRSALLLVAVAALAGGCGSASEERPPPAPGQPHATSFDEALDAEDGTHVELTGAVYADERPMRLCDALAESYPPQCARGIPLAGVTWAELPAVQRTSGVTWTDAAVRLVGEMRGGALHVREISPDE